ncbi:MAG: DUF4136 domain-containing protein [Steroidobacteraceae bacterium]
MIRALLLAQARLAAARLLGLTVGAIALAACATLRVGSDHDPAASFSTYHTYVWMPPHTNAYESPNPLVVQRAHDAIEDALSAKGYQLAGNAAQADVVVDFTIGSRERTDVQSYPAPYGGPWFGRSYWWGAPYWGSEVNVHQYREGTISIDIFDGRTHRPAWHGWARKELTHADLEHSAGSIREAVDSVLAQFPPK